MVFPNARQPVDRGVAAFAALWVAMGSLGLIGCGQAAIGEFVEVAATDSADDSEVASEVAFQIDAEPGTVPSDGVQSEPMPYWLQATLRSDRLPPEMSALLVDWLLPDRWTVAELRRRGVESVWIASVAPSEEFGEADWVVFATLSEPATLEQVAGWWGESLTPPPFGAKPPRPFIASVPRGEVAGLRAERGTYLPRVPTSRPLQIIGKDGQPAAKGIEIGDIRPRAKFIEGATPMRADIDLGKLAPSDLIDEELRLTITPEVFLTKSVRPAQPRPNRLEREWRDDVSPTALAEDRLPVMAVSLRDPDGDWESVPQIRAADSDRTNSVRFPRRVASRDDRAAPIDLLDADGVVVRLRAVDPHLYLGVSETRVQFAATGSDFLAMPDPQTVVVATSRGLFDAVLPRRPERTTEPSRTPAATIRIDPGPTTNQTFAALCKDVGWMLPPSAAEATGIEATLTDESALDIVIEVNDVATVSRDLREVVAAIDGYLADGWATQDIKRVEFFARFGGVFSDVSMALPSAVSDRLETEIPTLVDALRGMLGDIRIESGPVDRSGANVRLRLEVGEGWARLSEQAPVALAAGWATYAKELKERRKADRIGPAYDAAIAQLEAAGVDPQPYRLMKAWELAYNVSAGFYTSRRSRYPAVRRGALSLIDTVEANPDDELRRFLACIVGTKISGHPARRDFGPLFAVDDSLHSRLLGLLPLPDAVDLAAPNGSPEPRLLARALLAGCDSLAAERIDPLATLLLAYLAADLTLDGEFDAAAERWKQVSEELASLPPNQPSPDAEWGDTESDRISRAEIRGLLRLSERGWLKRRVRFERLFEIQTARRLSMRLEDALARGKVPDADAFAEPLQYLAVVQRSDPELFAEFAHDFKPTLAMADQAGIDFGEITAVRRVIRNAERPRGFHVLEIPAGRFDDDADR